MVYSTDSDPLCYPNSTVLINKAGISDAAELEQFELAMTLTRADEKWPDGMLDYSHYLAMHKHLFQDVYEWAGKPRTIRIGKGGNWFCYPEYIEGELQKVFTTFAEQSFFVNFDVAQFSKNAAHLLAEINAVHPFREGNGRTQLAFLIIVAENAGYSVDAMKLDQKKVMDAMVLSFSGDEKPLALLIKEIIS